MSTYLEIKAAFRVLLPVAFVFSPGCLLFAQPDATIQFGDPDASTRVTFAGQYIEKLQSETTVEGLLQNLAANDFPILILSPDRELHDRNLREVLLNRRCARLVELLDSMPVGESSKIVASFSRKTRGNVIEFIKCKVKACSLGRNSIDAPNVPTADRNIWQENHCAAFLLSRYSPSEVAAMETEIRDAAVAGVAALEQAENNELRMSGIRTIFRNDYPRVFWADLYRSMLFREKVEVPALDDHGQDNDIRAALFKWSVVDNTLPTFQLNVPGYVDKHNDADIIETVSISLDWDGRISKSEQERYLGQLRDRVSQTWPATAGAKE